MRETEYKIFKVEDYLDNEEVITEYLKAAEEENDPEFLQVAMAHAERARKRLKESDA